MEGIDLWPVVRGEKRGRDHVTVAWGPEITYIDDKWWCNDVFWGGAPLLYDLKSDPELKRNLAADHPEVVARAVAAFEEDAGGDFPEWLRDWPRSPGCTPILPQDD